MEDLAARTRSLEEQLEARDILGLRSVVTLGMDAQAFMASPLGRYIQARANFDLEAARDALLTVDPTDRSAVAAAQLAALVPSKVLHYIGQCVEEGKNAETQFIEADAARG